MVWRARCLASLAALATWGCGRVGIDLIDLSASLRDGGASADADSGAPRDAGRAQLDAGAVQDSAVAADGSTASACDGGACAPVCSLTGTFAVKIAITVNWPAGLVNAGTGASSVWARYTATQSGNTLTGTVEPCGFTLPEFALNPLVASETYQLSFPDTLFDHVPSYIPTSPLVVTSGSGFAVGQPFSFPDIAVLVGASMTSPLTDAWPSAAALAAPDVDADGEPGVTGLYNGATGYLFPRANVAGTQRADRAYAGARFVLNATGTTVSCSELTATGTFVHFDTHIVGCHVSGGADCTTAQRDQIDNGRPAFAPTASSLRIVKAPAGATCAQIRAMVP